MCEIKVPVSGEFYRHFKDKLYQIRDIAYHSETNEKMVVYQAMYGDFQVYVRPYSMFVEKVDPVKYPEVKQKFRFEKVKIDQTKPESLTSDSIVYNDFDDEDQDGSVDPRLLQFLDADNFQEKLNVLKSLNSNMDDRLINDIAISLDIIVEEGPIEKRYDSLRNCLLAHVKYEGSRLR